MNTQEIANEARYRYRERIALLCPVGKPTAVERSIARGEVRLWLRYQISK